MAALACSWSLCPSEYASLSLSFLIWQTGECHPLDSEAPRAEGASCSWPFLRVLLLLSSVFILSGMAWVISQMGKMKTHRTSEEHVGGDQGASALQIGFFLSTEVPCMPCSLY